MLLCLLPGAAAFAAEEAPSPEKVKALIEQLAADKFPQREAAEEALKACPRSILPMLTERADSDDPEISMRARRIATFLMEDPSKIPQACFVITLHPELQAAEQAGYWAQNQDAWRKKAKVGASNTTGKAFSAGGFAQSFIPRCAQIQAVEVAAYPIGASPGWLRLDLVADDNGKPGKQVLARSWLKIPVAQLGMNIDYLPFDLPDTPVQPDKRYWMVFAEHAVGVSRPGGYHSLTNFTNSDKDDYKDGALWWAGGDAADHGQDANFRIISECDKAPVTHEASEEEKKDMPDPKTIAPFRVREEDQRFYR
jgi:hypothetical protein